MATTDPALWSVDQVVHELCRSQAPAWLIGTDLKTVLNPNNLEQILHDNDIDGDMLLALNEENLKSDLLITSFGQRRSLQNIIFHLRTISSKYQAQLTRNVKSELETTHRSVQRTSTVADQDVIPSIEHNVKVEEDYTAQKNLGSNISNSYLESTGNKHCSTTYHAALDIAVPPLTQVVPEDRTLHQKRHKKTVRRANVLPASKAITAENMRTWFPEMQMHTTALDNEASHNKSDPSAKGVALPKATTDTHNTAQNLASHAKLHKRLTNYRADSIALPKATPKGIVLPLTLEGEPDYFEFNGAALTTGRLKNGIWLSDFNKTIKKRFEGQFGKSRSLTLSQSPASEGEGTERPHSLPPELMEILLHHPPEKSFDDLPKYGDSDEEDRWTVLSESQAPNNKDDVAKICLTNVAIDEIIDHSIKQFKAEWQTCKFLTAQIKVHKAWTTAAKSSIVRHGMLQKYQKQQYAAKVRIDRSRAGIHVSEWFKAEDVRQQCIALKESVHKYEEQTLLIQGLESQYEPYCPDESRIRQMRFHKINQITADGDEELDSDSHDSFFVTDGPFGDDDHDVLMTDIDNSGNNELPIVDPGTRLDVHNEDMTAITSTNPLPPKISVGPVGDTCAPVELITDIPRLPNLPNAYAEEPHSDGDDPTPIIRSRVNHTDENEIIDLTDPTHATRFDRFSTGFSTLSISEPPLKRTKRTYERGHDVDWPLLLDVCGVSDIDWSHFDSLEVIEDSDQHLAMAKFVYELHKDEVAELLRYIQSNSMNDIQEVLNAALENIQTGDSWNIHASKEDQHNADVLLDILLTYLRAFDSTADPNITEQEVDDAFQFVSSHLHGFCQILGKLLANYVRSPKIFIKPSRPISRKPPRSRLQSKMIKGRVIRSKDVLMQQKLDLRRVRQQEEKRVKLLQQQNSVTTVADQPVVTVNVDKPIVSLDAKLAARVKPHQITGIRFMWREVIANKKPRGCLLAHTMGLGKTMQVISLLTTIAQCNASPKPDVRNHIPPHLKNMKTMILCPSALVDNWFEELEAWLPDTMLLGPLIKLDKFVRQPETTIQTWFNQRGGVLILSYERLRKFVLPSKADKASIPKAILDRRCRQLLEGPSIVIADEAHKMKNAASKINAATNKIVTKSRIALTGSPLNNHLEEYHTLINWVSPGYLGTMMQFRARYIEPISRGLFMDCTDDERKNSMKRLHMLKMKIGPKVDRADISAIANDLPQKVEFLMTIALTEEQTEAYALFVEGLLGIHAGESGKQGHARLLSWLNNFTLLLNHPQCFIDNWRGRKTGTSQPIKSIARAVGADTDEDDDFDSTALVAGSTMSTRQPELADTMNKIINVFHEAKAKLGMDDPRLSNKTLLVAQILKEAVRQKEKTLIFSKSIPTLDYYENMVQDMGLSYKRIDGQSSANISSRQQEVKTFNTDDGMHVFLISTRAGGLGLNIQSASRVIINDFDFNPTWEEQAIGRAYRMGQEKPVFVYRFLVGGTFEEVIFNKAVFKTQLFTRVVDEKQVVAHATKDIGQYLFAPKPVPQAKFDDCDGKDPDVLDIVLKNVDCVRKIILTETFFQDSNEKLSEQEIKEADDLLKQEANGQLNSSPLVARFQQQQQVAPRRQAVPPPFNVQGANPPGGIPTYGHYGISHYNNSSLSMQHYSNAANSYARAFGHGQSPSLSGKKGRYTLQ